MVPPIKRYPTAGLTLERFVKQAVSGVAMRGPSGTDLITDDQPGMSDAEVSELLRHDEPMERRRGVELALRSPHVTGKARERLQREQGVVGLERAVASLLLQATERPTDAAVEGLLHDLDSVLAKEALPLDERLMALALRASVRRQIGVLAFRGWAPPKGHDDLAEGERRAAADLDAMEALAPAAQWPESVRLNAQFALVPRDFGPITAADAERRDRWPRGMRDARAKSMLYLPAGVDPSVEWAWTRRLTNPREAGAAVQELKAAIDAGGPRAALAAQLLLLCEYAPRHRFGEAEHSDLVRYAGKARLSPQEGLALWLRLTTLLPADKLDSHTALRHFVFLDQLEHDRANAHTSLQALIDADAGAPSTASHHLHLLRLGAIRHKYHPDHPTEGGLNAAQQRAVAEHFCASVRAAIARDPALASTYAQELISSHISDGDALDPVATRVLMSLHEQLARSGNEAR